MPKSHSFRFTQVAVDKLKPPASGRTEYNNTLIPGMQLRVSAARPGREPVKVYRVKARIGGIQVPMTIGSAAAFSLADANRVARDFLRQAAEGINPVEARRQTRKQADTVADRFERYARQVLAKRSAEYHKEVERSFRRDVLPEIGRISIEKLTRRQVRDVIDAIAERSESHAAHVRKYVNTFLNWCVDQDIIAVNPGVGPDPDTRKREDRERDRWLRDDEIRLFWYACNRSGGVFAPLFKLLLLLGARRDELADAPWAEFDLDRQLWTLPGRRSKNGNELITHLAEPALAILRALPRLRPSDPGELLFTTTGVTPIAHFDAPIKRVRREMAAMAGRPIEHFTIHDLRRSLASGMAELGIAESVVDRVLNHRAGRAVSAVARIYNRAEYRAERRDALEKWSAHVMRLVGPALVSEEAAG